MDPVPDPTPPPDPLPDPLPEPTPTEAVISVDRLVVGGVALHLAAVATLVAAT